MHKVSYYDETKVENGERDAEQEQDEKLEAEKDEKLWVDLSFKSMSSSKPTLLLLRGSGARWSKTQRSCRGCRVAAPAAPRKELAAEEISGSAAYCPREPPCRYG